jgi:hypothetical protein
MVIAKIADAAVVAVAGDAAAIVGNAKVRLVRRMHRRRATPRTRAFRKPQLRPRARARDPRPQAPGPRSRSRRRYRSQRHTSQARGSVRSGQACRFIIGAGRFRGCRFGAPPSCIRAARTR